jgi:hypothetical protein
MKWEKKESPGRPTVWVTFIKKDRISIAGREFKADEAVRIISEKSGFRVDFAGSVAGTWLPWEAVSNTVFSTLQEAKQTAKDYASAVSD